MKRYRLTQNAASDMQSIGRYTTERWGRDQRSIYLRQVNSRFAWLAENPRLGKNRLDINERYYCFPEAEHIIFYQVNGDTIEIIGVPHRQMDILSYFKTLTQHPKTPRPSDP